MVLNFKMTPDLGSRRITIAVIILVAIAAVCLTFIHINSGGYLPVWFITIAVIVGLLFIISIPRRICVDGTGMEVHCILELVRIEAEDMLSVRRVEDLRTDFVVLLGSYGFFGYYGYYLDRRRWRIVQVYARTLSNLIEIQDIYEQRYLVTCDDSETFFKAVNELRRKQRHGSINER